jgi:hypothetical protein
MASSHPTGASNWRIPDKRGSHVSDRVDRKDMPAKQSFIFCEMARVWSRKRNRAGSGAAIIRRGGAALNHYKQAIFPHGRVIKSALARYGIGAMGSVE